MDRFTNEVEGVTPEEEELAGLTSRITGFLQDESGIFWIATQRGLFSYDSKSGLFFNETAGGILNIRYPCISMEFGDRSSGSAPTVDW